MKLKRYFCTSAFCSQGGDEQNSKYHFCHTEKQLLKIKQYAQRVPVHPPYAQPLPQYKSKERDRERSIWLAEEEVCWVIDCVCVCGCVSARVCVCVYRERRATVTEEWRSSKVSYAATAPHIKSNHFSRIFSILKLHAQHCLYVIMQTRPVQIAPAERMNPDSCLQYMKMTDKCIHGEGQEKKCRCCGNECVCDFVDEGIRCPECCLLRFIVF